VDERELTSNLLEEIFKALGWEEGHLLRAPMTPFFAAVCRRFARLAMRFEQDVAGQGFCEATRRILPHFVHSVHICGAEYAPTDGPLLVVSNHPGTVDGLAIAAHLPRPDLKIVVSGVPFIRRLRSTANHLIYSSLEPFERMRVVRASMPESTPQVVFDICGAWEYTMTANNGNTYDAGIMTFEGEPAKGKYLQVNIYQVEYQGEYAVNGQALKLTGQETWQGTIENVNTITGVWCREAGANGTFVARRK